MKTVSVALLFAASVTTAAAQPESCNRFSHETDANDWLADAGEKIRWHKDGTVYTQKAGSGDGLRYATGMSLDEPAVEIPYRVANVEGRRTLIWDGTFFFEDCGPNRKADRL